MDFGAREVAAEAPEIFLAAPEMALELESVMELVKALEIAPSSRWVLSFQP